MMRLEVVGIMIDTAFSSSLSSKLILFITILFNRGGVMLVRVLGILITINPLQKGSSFLSVINFDTIN